MGLLKSNNIRRTILIPFVLTLLAVILLFVGSAYLREQEARDLAFRNLKEYVFSEYQEQLDTDANAMHVAIKSVFQSWRIRAAFEAQDRDALLALTNDLFAHYRKRHFFTHFYFVTPERKALLRVHSSKRHGDTIDRQTMRAAERTGKSVTGLEMGTYGTFTLRVIVPWFVDKRLIGYVELGQEIDHIVRNIEQRFDLKLVTAINKQLLQQKDWKVGLEFTGRLQEWDLFEDVVVTHLNRHEAALTPLVQNVLEDHRDVKIHDQTLPTYKLADRNYLLDLISLKDYGNRDVGNLVIIQDRTLEDRLFQNNILMVTVLSLLAGGVIFAIFFIILGRVQKGIIRDENALFQAKEEAERTEKNLIQAQSVANIGNWSLDLKTEKLWWSDEIFKIFGIDSSAFGANLETFLNVVHPDDRAYVNEQYQGAVDGKFPYDIEHRITRQDNGEVLWVHERCEHIRDDAGQVIRSDGVVQNITKRKLAEEALRVSQEQYQGIFDTALTSIVLVDAKGDITDINRYHVDHVGKGHIAKEKYLGYNIVAEPSIVGAGLSEQYESVLTGNTIDLEGVFFPSTTGGMSGYFNIKGTPLVKGGKVIGGVFVHEDVTTLKQTEKHLTKAMLTAEHANIAKSNFLANMSHELRTPLNAIIGFSQLLEAKLNGPLGSPKNEEYVSLIHGAGEHLFKLISEILDLSKIEAGEMELDEEEVSVHDVVEECLQIVSSRATKNQLMLSPDLPSDLPYLQADRVKVKQILINLLSNALKFTPAGGSVNVTCELDSNNGVCLTVTDTGIGIAEIDLAKVFHPFEQLEESSKYNKEGTGLGLALTEQLAGLHQAKIKLDSTPGEGTTVTVSFPSERTVF
jgi:PAS domain S-box-containing protein